MLVWFHGKNGGTGFLPLPAKLCFTPPVVVLLDGREAASHGILGDHPRAVGDELPKASQGARFTLGEARLGLRPFPVSAVLWTICRE